MIHSGLCPTDPHRDIWDSGTFELGKRQEPHHIKVMRLRRFLILIPYRETQELLSLNQDRLHLTHGPVFRYQYSLLGRRYLFTSKDFIYKNNYQDKHN